MTKPKPYKEGTTPRTPTLNGKCIRFQYVVRPSEGVRYHRVELKANHTESSWLLGAIIPVVPGVGVSRMCQSALSLVYGSNDRNWMKRVHAYYKRCDRYDHLLDIEPYRLPNI